MDRCVHVADRFNENINGCFHISINAASLCSKEDCFFGLGFGLDLPNKTLILDIYLLWFEVGNATQSYLPDILKPTHKAKIC